MLTVVDRFRHVSPTSADPAHCVEIVLLRDDYGLRAGSESACWRVQAGPCDQAPDTEWLFEEASTARRAFSRTVKHRTQPLSDPAEQE